MLGHVVDPTGLHTDPNKITAILQLPVPQNRKELLSFLGLFNYYRKFVPRFADIARPLHALTSVSASPWQWSPECQSAFTALKTALTSQPVLALPDFSRPFSSSLHCDASNVGLGDVLSQLDEVSGTDRPIAFYSRRLSPAECNYSVTERELLAVIFAVSKTRPYIFGRTTEVVTDHAALRFLLGTKDLSGRLARWSLALQQFDLNVQTLTQMHCPVYR